MVATNNEETNDTFEKSVTQNTQLHSLKKPKKLCKGTQILSPNIRYFVAIYQDLSRFTHFVEDLGPKKTFLGGGSNTVFMWQEVPFYMVYIAYYTEFNLQLCYVQKRCICREDSKYAPDLNGDVAPAPSQHLCGCSEGK